MSRLVRERDLHCEGDEPLDLGLYLGVDRDRRDEAAPGRWGRRGAR